MIMINSFYVNRQRENLAGNNLFRILVLHLILLSGVRILKEVELAL